MTSGALMAAEMREQPVVLARLVARFDEHLDTVRAVLPRRLEGVHLVARGSSDHAAVFGRYLAELASGRPAGLVAPSLHTRYGARVDYRGQLVVALSQSGMTPEIVTVVERLRAAGAVAVAVVNDRASRLAEVSDAVIALEAGPERAVPATKTLTAQFLAVAMIAAALGPLPVARGDLAALPGEAAEVLGDAEPAAALAASWDGADRVIVTGRGLLCAAALEVALKIKETAAIMAEGLSTADLLHGPIGAVGPRVPVLILDGPGPAGDEGSVLRARITALGAPVASCSTRSGCELPLPADTPWPLVAIPAVVRGQQLARELALARGRDADAPPHLTKVTATS